MLTTLVLNVDYHRVVEIESHIYRSVEKTSRDQTVLLRAHFVTGARQVLEQPVEAGLADVVKAAAALGEMAIDGGLSPHGVLFLILMLASLGAAF